MPMNVQENVLPIEGSSRVLARHDRRIGSILAEEGKLGGGDIERVMELQQTEGLRFGEAALRLGLITADDLRCAVAKQYDLPHLLPGNESISSELVVAYEPFHPRAEELRALRTQLLMRWSNTKSGLRRRAQLRGRQPGGGFLATRRTYASDRRRPAHAATTPDLQRPRPDRPFGGALRPRRPQRDHADPGIRETFASAGRRAPAQSTGAAVASLTRCFPAGNVDRVRHHPHRYAPGETLRGCAERDLPRRQCDDARPQRPYPSCRYG